MTVELPNPSFMGRWYSEKDMADHAQACNLQLISALKEIHRAAATSENFERSTIMALKDIADSALASVGAA